MFIGCVRAVDIANKLDNFQESCPNKYTISITINTSNDYLKFDNI